MLLIKNWAMKYLFFLLFFSSNFVFAQQNTDWQKHLDNAVSEYRLELLKDINSSSDIVKTIEYLSNIETDINSFDRLLLNLHNWYTIKDKSINRILKSVVRNAPNSHLAKHITSLEKKELKSFKAVLKTNLEIIKKHSELTDLIIHKYLEKQFPFDLHSIENTKKELDFYKIIDGDIIAEIGAGNGVFSQMIVMSGNEVQLYINELGPLKIKYLSNKFHSFDVGNPPIFTKVIAGENDKTKLPVKVDKIIVRNTFHHFRFKKKMLKSIYSDLKNNGRLFVYESLKDESKPENCKYKLSENEIKSIISENGFILINEFQLFENTIILEYKKP